MKPFSSYGKKVLFALDIFQTVFILLKILPREDKEALELCKAMYKRGECPPLSVVFDPIEG